MKKGFKFLGIIMIAAAMMTTYSFIKKGEGMKPTPMPSLVTINKLT